MGARLQPGESFQQAQAFLDSVARRLSQQYPDTDKDFTVKVHPELGARPIPQAGSLVVVLSGLFLGLTTIVLVLACVNVANMFLVRSTAREREMVTRAALGAPRSRLVRQLLMESVLLAIAGGVAGILFGSWMRIPIVRGRTLTEADDEKSQYIAIVNETMVKRFWPNQDPVGRQFTMSRESNHPMQVVGVARNSRFLGVVPSWPIDAYFYVPYAQHYETNSLETVQVRTAGPPELMIPEVEGVVASLAPDLPVFDAQTMTEALNTLVGLLIFEIGAVLAGAFGILGLTLAIIGVYAVISYTLGQRTQEIGIRMAFGANSQDVLLMILGEGFVIVGAGLTIGLAGAVSAARVVRNFVTVSATDPLTYLAVSATLAVVSLLAGYVPARRATKVDPMVALRYE